MLILSNTEADPSLITTTFPLFLPSSFQLSSQHQNTYFKYFYIIINLWFSGPQRSRCGWSLQEASCYRREPHLAWSMDSLTLLLSTDKSFFPLPSSPFSLPLLHFTLLNSDTYWRMLSLASADYLMVLFQEVLDWLKREGRPQAARGGRTTWC